jgi:DNA repair exonuclease SbcCD ATPase subunit
MTDTLRIISLEMENFLSVKSKISLNLGNRGLVLVEGNNGAGKSACFVDALCYGVYGKTMRGVSKDDIVNRFAGKNCCVGVKMLDSDGDLVEIESYRKHFKHKDNVIFKINGKTKLGATNDHTRDMIVKYLDMDFTAFSNSVVFGQSMVKYFSGLTDSEQKKVVDRLLGITWIPEAWEVAKEDLGVFEKEKNRLEILVGTKETQIKMKLLEIEEEQNRFTGFESVRADTILSIKSELESLKLTDITTLNEKVALLDTEISNLKLQFNEDDFNKLQDKILAMNKEKGIYEGRINYKDTDIKKLNLSLLNLHKKVGTVCSACGQEIKEEFVGFHKIHLLEEINKLEKEFAEINKEFKAIGVEYSDLLSNKQVLLKIKNDILDLVFVKDDCERILYKTNVENARISSQKGGLEKKLEEVVSSDNPYNVDKIEGDLQNILQEQKEFNDSLDKLNDEIKYHTFWVAGFSNAGIKSLIIESMMPQMNQWASAYSGLFDSKFDIKFFAQTKLKKGDFAEKFDVAAFNKVGAQMYDGNSGGEKRVIDLIVMFVLGDLASSRSSKRFSILVMDEIFERLDEEICDKVICVLRSMIGGNGILGTDCMPQRESIFVLTHLDYFKSRFENRIRTWKDRDETKIYDGG